MAGSIPPPLNTPAGFAPVEPLSFKPVLALPAALAIDGTTRDFIPTEDGQLQSIHPVDQRAYISLTYRLGSIGSATAVGSGVQNIKVLREEKINRQVQGAVGDALKSQIDAGDVVVLGSAGQIQEHGRLVTVVDYVNMKLSPDSVRRFTFDSNQNSGTLENL